MLSSFRWRIILPSVSLAVLLPLFFHMIWQNWYAEDIANTIEEHWMRQLQYAEQINNDYEIVNYMNYLITAADAPTETYIDIIEGDRKMYWSSDPASYEKRRNQRHIFSEDGGEVVDNRDGNLYIVVPLGESGFSKRYAELTYPIEEVITEQIVRKQKTVWMTMGALAVLGIIAGGYLWRTISQPIYQLTTIAKKVTEGQYEHHIYRKGTDEFGRLAHAFNQMIRSIHEKVTELSDEKSKLEGVLNNMLSGVLLINMKGQVRYANLSAERILHANKGSLVSKSYQDVLGSYGLSSKIEGALTKGEVYRDQIHLKNAMAPYAVEVSIVPIRNINRLIHSVLVVIHDISEIKRLEQVRAEFVANVSHELKTPITSIKGFAETILDGNIDDREEMLEFTKIIYKEAERLSNLVHDLLELSKLEAHDASLSRQNEDIVEIAREVVNHLKHGAIKKHRDINLYANRDKIIHFVNRDRIKQVLINLISNSIAYSKLHTPVYVRLFDNDHDVVIEVEDHGIGIPESDLPRIFERFYRVQKDRSRATGGTGLGLSIVKHIIEIHEGNIEVDSKVGVGTTFRIVFPKLQL